MKHSLFWIALCSIAICDVRGKRQEDGNNVQSSVLEELDNGKHGAHYNKPLGHRVDFGQGRNRSQQAPLDVQDRTPRPSPGPFANPLQHASESEGKLTMDFMAEARKLSGGSDFVLSPFGIWGITTMIFSAAGGKTADELSKLLRTEASPSRIEAAYKAAYQAVNLQSDSVKSVVANIAAANEGEKLSGDLLNHFETVFNTRWFGINPGDGKSSADKVNRWAASATNNRITEIVQPADFKDLKILLACATFFKGRWQQPFNISATSPDIFKNENDAVVVRDVPMMRMRGILRYGYSVKLDCQTLELPYADGITSMIVFLPKRRVSVQTVLENMRGSSLRQLLPPEMSDEEVDVSLPRFSTQFHADLNAVYVNLKADSMHGSYAELPGFGKDTFISKISHIAEIETTEEGTTASSVTTASVSYKTSATTFQANRPFIYFINHMPSRLVLFSGIVTKPSNN